MIRTIIFDMGRVIIPFDFTRGYDRMAPLCGLTPAEIPERLRTCDLVSRFESGRMEPDAFVREMGTVLGMDCDVEQFAEIWGSIFLPETLLPESLLQALAARYRLLLLSNTNALHWDLITRTYPLMRHFHDHVLSWRVGALKPSPAIYRAAIDAAGCRPEECFFTDDIPVYVEAAQSHGIDAVVFENREQIEGELRRRGVEW